MIGIEAAMTHVVTNYVDWMCESGMIRRQVSFILLDSARSQLGSPPLSVNKVISLES